MMTMASTGNVCSQETVCPTPWRKATQLYGGRLYPIPDDSDVYAVMLKDGMRVSSPTCPEDNGGFVTLGLFDGGAMVVPLYSIRYVRVLPNVEEDNCER